MSFPKSPFSGFPFDDDFDRDRTSFRTQLDDIAQRHPEFAQHLNFGGEFPFRGRRRSNERPQHVPEPEFPRRHERPFGSRFEEFGFPFNRHFDEPDFYQEEAPQQPPTQPAEKEVPQDKEEKKQEEPVNVEQETPKPQANQELRKQNIQQSNTVDLGKNQEPLDDQRGQRSMSAPPENRPAQQRFVSSINIPIQTQSGGGDMGARASQPESQKPNERVIPIHVEGRDEPVLPKNANFTPPPPQQQQQPQAERIFGRNPSHFTQFLNKGEPQMTPEEYYKQQQKNYQQQHQQNFQQQQQQQQAQEAPQEQQAEQEAPKASKPGQIEQIQSIQKDVLELMNQVEKFEGKPRDKQYLYLDEMLTRNLIKLDNIETEGKENIRQARKEAIKCIEGCIGILEAKANDNEARANANQATANADQATANPSEAEAVQEVQENKMEIEKVTEEKVEEKKPEEPPAVKPEESTLEVSGVSRTGTVISTDEATPMEVEAPAEEKKQEEKKKEEAVDEPTQSGEAPPQPVEDKPEEKKEKKKGKKKDKAEKK